MYALELRAERRSAVEVSIATGFHNKERPHHALNLDTPSQWYTPSEKPYPERTSPWEYPPDCTYGGFAGTEITIRRSHIHGCISLFFRNFRIGRIDVEKRVYTFRRSYLIEGDPRR